MIRTMTADEPDGITVTLDGKLSDQGVEPVAVCCMDAVSRGKPVWLSLRVLPRSTNVAEPCFSASRPRALPYPPRAFIALRSLRKSVRNASSVRHAPMARAGPTSDEGRVASHGNE
jgi:hypothetical protein